MAMNEQERLEDLLEYQILDTEPEKDLDELIEIASAICETPMSLITLIDDKRQWFKAAKGFEERETSREDSFCKHALHRPDEVLVVDDPLNDERFKNHRHVQGDPNIRFYAGAPLQTPKGNVLGTLCVIDNKPHTISESQKHALRLLAKKAMDFLNARKRLIIQRQRLESNAAHLKKLTDLAPGCVYQMRMINEGEFIFDFVSEGITELDSSLTAAGLYQQPALFFDSVFCDDCSRFKTAFIDSFLTLRPVNVQFRVAEHAGKQLWFWAKGRPERKEDGSVVWYGVFQNITEVREYENALEQICFDISHVLRRPVTTMLALTKVIEKYDLKPEQIQEYAGYIKTVSEEMDNFTRKLNQVYYEKKEGIRHHHSRYDEAGH